MNKILKMLAILLLTTLVCIGVANILSKNEIKEIKRYNVSKLTNSIGSEKHDLPIVVINTKGQKLEYRGKDEEVSKDIIADIEIYDSGEKNSLTESPIIQEKILLNLRGNTTKSLPKKQYSIKFIGNNNNEIEKEVLGMNKSSKWILNASFEDKSLLRNYLVYNLSQNIVEYAPNAKFCEVYYIDDDSNTISSENYVGIYIMVEKIENGENGVHISDTVKGKEETSYIVGKNNAKTGDNIIHNYGLETYLYDYNTIIEYPKAELTEEKKEYINQSVSEFERSLYSDYFDDEEKGYAQYIDVDSFVNYYIINEFFKNTDAGTFSTYIYKDIREKIKAGPIWDFDNALGNSTSVGEYNDPTGFYTANAAWFNKLIKDEKFVDKVIYRYETLRETYLSNENIMNMIDESYNYIYNTQKKNFEVWPMDICNQSEMFKNYYGLLRGYGSDIEAIRQFIKENPRHAVPTDSMASTYDEEVEMLKTFICERGKWMDENINSLKKFA